jgi:CheY-like chemotaxis protein
MTKTILLADDSLTIQKVVELTFADTQYHVVAVSSGDELLEKLPEVRPEVVICDIIMPGRDGYDVCQNIKSNSDTLHIPVILLSGTFEPFDRDRALAAGCSEIITKPFEAKRLVDAVEKLFSVSADDSGPAPRAESTPGLEPAAAGPEVDFGTQLSPPAEVAETAFVDGADEPPEGSTSDDGIDFTTSGFAEMEAAAETATEPPVQTAAGGIEFEVGTVSEPADRIEIDDPDDEHFADAFSIEGGDSADDGSSPDPFGAVEEPPAAAEEDDATDGPFADAFGAADAATDAEPPQPAEFDLKTAEEAFSAEPAPVVLTDADTAPVPPLEDDAPAEQPVAADGLAPAADEPQAPGEEILTGGPLSDEDVDRIAQRVVELAFDRIEQVAWEVIPDVAEVAVRERIRQLESEYETEN